MTDLGSDERKRDCSRPRPCDTTSPRISKTYKKMAHNQTHKNTTKNDFFSQAIHIFYSSKKNVNHLRKDASLAPTAKRLQSRQGGNVPPRPKTGNGFLNIIRKGHKIEN